MELQAGWAVSDITPAVGVEIAGYGFGPSVGILDPLEAQLLYLEAGGESLAIASVDLLGFGPESLEVVRRAVEKETGIPGERVLVAASHSHSAPTTLPLRQWGIVDGAYAVRVEGALVDAARRARAAMSPALISVGTGSGNGLNANRRAGATVTDPALPFLRVDAAGRAGPAIVYGYGCHPVALHGYRNLVSADYPGRTRALLREELGAETAALFMLGPSGDINPAGYVHGAATEGRAQRLGGSLARELLRVAYSAPVADPALRFSRTVLDLPVVELPREEELRGLYELRAAEAEAAREAGESWQARSEIEIQRDWAADALAARRGGARRRLRCELTAFRIGPCVILAVPLEVFAETGLAIRRASPCAVTLIATNANGCLGYLPTADAYRVADYTNPDGMAPKVYGIYALAPEAEPLLRAGAASLLQGLS